MGVLCGVSTLPRDVEMTGSLAHVRRSDDGSCVAGGGKVRGVQCVIARPDPQIGSASPMKAGSLGSQPADGDEMLDSVKFRIACQNRSGEALGCRNAEGVRIGDCMFTLDLGSFPDERQVNRNQFDRQLFQKVEGFSGSGGADLAFDDVEELTPIDPIQKSLAPAPLLFIERGSNFFPTRLLMKETDQGEAIENELSAHGAPPLDVRAGARPSGRICP